MSNDIGIWYRYAGNAPEKIDTAYSYGGAERLLAEYTMAFGLRHGDHRYGKDKLWIGRRKDEP